MPRCKNCKEKYEKKYPNQFGKFNFCLLKDECIQAFTDAQKQERVKQAQKKKRELAPVLHETRYKHYLDAEIQKLARLIDAKFNHTTCIDCNKPFGKQIDGGHRHSKGANPSIRWNLHNIHSQKSDCNQNGIGGGKELGYHEGLIDRYSKSYADFIRYDLVREYPYIGIKGQEIADKLKIVRKLVRDFDTFDFKNSIQARNQLNQIIGIYTKTQFNETSI